ncbi:Sec7-domain-containing protein [Guyanagaster necrorhizus]|uniref:Sec7-domain-containing protein n=1 Tax=Guyanagaster necrorhizus TaxID=856835 RepID=A0A9P7VZX6_9AGAR|nr:Sec7-domain-containing protein [Guyanagaster necrorhizus MCA 3950]KAG7449384.1 Sec7-domain-containing protein [Guyanagaster necrorhizus MCA 3950]
MATTNSTLLDMEDSSSVPESVPLPASPPVDAQMSTSTPPAVDLPGEMTQGFIEAPIDDVQEAKFSHDVLPVEAAEPEDTRSAHPEDLPAPMPERPAERADIIDNISTGLSEDSVSTQLPSRPAKLPSIPKPLELDVPHEPRPPPPVSPSESTHRRSLTISKGQHTVSVVLISSALETIAASKDAKRSAPLRESTQRALEMIRSEQAGDRPREIFEPLRLACETRTEKLMIASLDCISKLISYSFFAESIPPSAHFMSPPGSPGFHPRQSTGGDPQRDTNPPSLVDLVVHTITSCHSETTPETVSLQIVKALLALVLSPTVLVHHSALLKAVRTVYNIFLLSADPVNQMVAQGGLTQMTHHVFTRCKTGMQRDSSTFASSSSQGSVPSFSRRASLAGIILLNGKGGSSAGLPESASSASLPLQQPSINGDDAVPATNGNGEHEDGTNFTSNGVEETHTDVPPEDEHYLHSEMTLNDLFIKDAFLVFRALCKLTMKPLNNESERDLKSHAMRSKLLSLHLVLTVLNSHMALFVDPASIIYSNTSNDATSFVQAVNQYICLSLSRNAVSPVPQVFDLSVEIFWRVLSGMRTKLKKEIEVLLHEIFIPILEMRTSTLKQKAVILGLLSRLSQDPQALVEIYLNYDCDGEAADNIYEHLMNIISKICTTQSTSSHQKGNEPPSPATQPATKPHSNVLGPSLSTSVASVPGSMDTATLGLSETQLRRQGLECLVTVLRSLVAWGTTSGKVADGESVDIPSRSQPGENIRRDSLTPDTSLDKLSGVNSSTEGFRQHTPDLGDDPTKFESAKQKKTTLLEGIKKFNFKPKRGVHFLIETDFIPSNDPRDIASFLLNTDGLSKAMIGEYLGEGDQENIDIMHAFVDSLNFAGCPFVDALRLFLQKFRLPGEAQKIDRYMLKFANRFIASNTQTPFTNADAAYVLAYSVIMLNTDAHNPQVKKRMTKVEFIKNNRGINDGNNLPDEFMSEIYDEIVSNEIRMQGEIEAAGPLPTGPGLANALANVGRDLQKEAYVLQSSGMANKTEALFRTMMRTQRKGSRPADQFFSASHFVHVRPMFEVAWIAFLAGLSGPLQDTDDLEIVELCLDGFKSAIRIVCFFDLELERNAFVTTLAKFTFLNNLGEMKAKNMEAIKTLLDVAVTDGNNLKGSWHEVLTCVSQLEHMQLISGGVDVDGGRKGKTKKPPTEELANESRSTHITVATDMVFSLSHFLSGTAIVDFVQALSDVSWEEIQSSGLSQHPRLFSLQKLVEISYYNMNRIRLEWSNLWEILGEHFNKVCCHDNPHVGFFALDALRQLAMRFLEKEELPHFKFQKDFLKPFEHTMIHNPNPEARDMVLQCLQQMIQARVQNMRSGWRTMFSVFQAASKVVTERIANSAFEIVTRLNKEHFPAIVRYGAFADLVVCITEFCKVSKYQKISLLAIAMLRGVIPVMLESPECGWSSSTLDDNMVKYWYPVLFAFYDIIMNGEDLEVRRLALDSLFSSLKTYGSSFPENFWDSVTKDLIFPIFSVLKSSHDLSRFSTQEDMSVWLSSTMIQALRDVIDLFTFYFDTLERSLDGLLDLLCICICQENDTLAHIGTSCLQQLVENNVEKLSAARWERITSTFVKLFMTTTPHQLFDDSLRVEIESSSPGISEESNGTAILPAPLSPSGDSPQQGQTAAERQRIFKQIIVKCVLQLLLIETTNELLRNEKVYMMIPPNQLLPLVQVLGQSYQFARSFNEDKELRTGLWKVGFMKHLPNLLKQESSSASTLAHILLRMFFDQRPEHQRYRDKVDERLLPLSIGVIQDYNKLRAETQGKNIVAWTPVVAEIMDGFCRFDDKTFAVYLPAVYPVVTDLLGRDLAPEVRVSLKTYFLRVGYAHGIIEVSS